VILVGMALRLAMLGLNVRFHPDEALFAAQARLISHGGDFFLRTTDLDKPPLTFYVTALSFRVLGPTEFAARLPNVLFSSLSLAVLYRLASSLFRDRITATLATLLWALSPYDLAFAATAFTDIQATFWVLLASLLAVHDRWRSAGVAAALAFAAKSNALLFVPLILALGTAQNARTDWRISDVLRRLWQFTWPLVVVMGLVVLWDLGRAPRSFLSLGYARNNPGRLVRADEVWPRLRSWAHWLGFVTGSPVLNVLLVVTSPVQLAYGALRQRSRAAVADWLIAGFGLAFLACYWLIAFNTYDRYLHTLVPFLLLIAARTLTGVWHFSGVRQGVLAALTVITIGVMAPGVTRTLRGEMAIGGDQGKDTGIDALADYLNTRLSGEIIYDHWLGWELAYYLGETPEVTVVYSPLPEALASDMAQQPGSRYFAVPSPQQAAPWIAVLHRVGVQATAIYVDPDHSFVVYRLDAPKHG
jgi:4-amino-4-deoxy-L-arabinose transferase-like glycosyltransferase